MNLVDIKIAALGAAVSLLISVAIIMTTKWHGEHTLDWTGGVQKFHFAPTPRVGGIAIMCGLVAVCAAGTMPLRELLFPVLLSSLPSFLFGLAEDLTKKVNASARLLATMASGGLGWLLTGASVASVGVPAVDAVLATVPAALLFTAFAVAGVANAVNIIDGFNGLASGTAVICFTALGAIAANSGDFTLAQLCFTVGAVTAGFFLLNFPFGHVFLGDGGAYLLGFLMAWLGVMLSYRNPTVSVWAPFLACSYPICETIYTIARRLRSGAHPFDPDDRHLHSLIKVGVVLRLYPTLRADLRNALVSPFSWSIAIIPAMLAVVFAESSTALFLSFVFAFTLYVCVYRYAAAASRRRQQMAEVVALGDLPAETRLPPQRISGGA
jgi:UDP-N-acetylmuramyl pentapeptide phosphotransferase/UDP-N-acetylglucosamine-1-phosphate transferase